MLLSEIKLAKIVSNTFAKAVEKNTQWASGSFEDEELEFTAPVSRYGINKKEFKNGDVSYTIGIKLTDEQIVGLNNLGKACVEATPQGYAFVEPMKNEYLYLKCKTTDDKFDFETNIKGLSPTNLSGSTKKKQIDFSGEVYMYYDTKKKVTGMVIKPLKLKFNK